MTMEIYETPADKQAKRDPELAEGACRLHAESECISKLQNNNLCENSLFIKLRNSNSSFP